MSSGKAVLFVVEDVLAQPHPEFVASPPMTNGVALFTALCGDGKRKAFFWSAMGDREQLRHWLVVNLFLKSQPNLLLDMERTEAITAVRALGYDLEYFVDADPSGAAQAMSIGQTALLFASPSYARPEFRPDAPKELRKWSDIEEEAVRQRSLLATDERREIDPSLARFIS